jgi:hypothetical protein
MPAKKDSAKKASAKKPSDKKPKGQLLNEIAQDFVKMPTSQRKSIAKCSKMVKAGHLSPRKLNKMLNKMDPNAPVKPKRAPSAFIKYSSEMRPLVRKDHPNDPLTGIAKRLGVMWQELSDAEKANWASAPASKKRKAPDSSKKASSKKASSKKAKKVKGAAPTRQSPRNKK